MHSCNKNNIIRSVKKLLQNFYPFSRTPSLRNIHSNIITGEVYRTLEKIKKRKIILILKKKAQKGKTVLSLCNRNYRCGKSSRSQRSWHLMIMVEPPKIGELPRSIRTERRRRRQVNRQPNLTGERHLRRYSFLVPLPTRARTHQRTQTERHIIASRLTQPSSYAAAPFRRRRRPPRGVPPALRRRRRRVPARYTFKPLRLVSAVIRNPSRRHSPI